MKRFHVFAGILSALALLAGQLPAAAQADYPTKALTMIVPPSLAARGLDTLTL